MGRKHSPADAAWLLLKLSAADQALYDAEMQSLQRPDPEFNWGGIPQPQLPPGPSKLTDFDSTMFDPEEPDNRINLGQAGLQQGIPVEGMKTDPRFVDRMLEEEKRRDVSPYRDELRSHLQMGIIPPEWAFTEPSDRMTDDMDVMYAKYLDEGLGKLNPQAYFSSAFDGTIKGGLLDMGDFGEAAEIRAMLREQAEKQGGPEGQPPLGAFHPHFPNPHDLAWVEPSPDHPPELAAQIEHDRKYPMSFFRQTPEMSTPGRTWVDPKTEELTSTKGTVPLDPYTKTIGLPRLTSIQGTSGFEEGSAVGSGKPKNRPFPMKNTPGLFATTPSLKDMERIVSITPMGGSPVYTGIRGDPHKEPMWLRAPENAPESLHEAYLHEAQPASKRFDPFSLIPGRERAERHGDVDFWREGNMQAMMERLIGSHIPSITASLDREGKPMTIDTGDARGEMDVLDYMEDIYGLHGHRGSKDVDEIGEDKLRDMVNHLSEKYDLPKELLEGHFNSGKNMSTMKRLAENRFMYNAAKTSGIDFHPTRKIPFPRDEHGFPLNPSGEQMSSNALNLLGLESSDTRGVGYRAPSEVRHTRMPLQDEQVLLNPPTNRELSQLRHNYGINTGNNYLSQGMTDPMKEALRDLRSKQQRRRGVGNETV